jgi:cyclopropane-fatty-acyl-phospholipid synthase
VDPGWIQPIDEIELWVEERPPKHRIVSQPRPQRRVSRMLKLTPFYENVLSHYDLSDEFFTLFLDPTRTYSCAYFAREDLTLEQAQLAKIDLTLGKCDLRPGMTLLDVGCGWGSAMLRAIEHYDVNVIGLTLSRNQYDHVSEFFSRLPVTGRTAQVRLQGGKTSTAKWIGSSASVRSSTSAANATTHSSSGPLAFCPTTAGCCCTPSSATHGRCSRPWGVEVTRDDALFLRFILREIFPGGQLPDRGLVITRAQRHGFWVQNIESLQPHYARTLDLWAEALAAHRDDAVRLASEQVYQRYIKYLTGCADNFRRRLIDVQQFTLIK